MNNHNALTCILMLLIALNIFFLVYEAFQMYSNIEFGKRLERIRKRLALKEAKIDLLLLQARKVSHEKP